MNVDKYPLEASGNFIEFHFTSIGPKGEIRKKIRYVPMDILNVWNLGFGDINPITGDVSDEIVSNNGDRQKILITVAQTAIEFTNHYPEAIIYAEGSSPSRTRLYRIGISNNFEMIDTIFIVWGLSEDKWELFVKGKNYEAFLIKRK
ncbi:DUF6934 family protein [Runella sp.]|uniref:DUF6934 family protein n=1 Tax=Runella sp. TaxID=1960881 RepID=UPI003D0FF7D1